MNKCSNLNLNPIAPKISNKSERNFFFSLSSVASRSRCFVWTRVGNDIQPYSGGNVFFSIQEWFCFVYLSNLKDFYPYLGVGLSLVFNFDFVILNQQTWSLVLEPVERFKINQDQMVMNYCDINGKYRYVLYFSSLSN